MVMPAWVAGRTLYHLHSLRAAAGGGIGALQGWLDHVHDLGCGAVLLTPIHESSTHGYDTVDAFRLDPRFGDDGAFDAFVTACHERDLKLVLDGVLNHVGRAFESPALVRSDGKVFEGHDELPRLDHDNPATLEWAVGVTNHWLERGADGWRFDVAYAMPPSFLRSLTEQVRARHPEAFLFGEMIHGDYAAFVASSGLDSVTQYELYKAVWSSLHDRNPHELAWALQRHATFASAFPPVTFLGNHDVTRLASRLADPGAQLGPALAVLATVPGIPCGYYGDELDAVGIKEDRVGGDDAVRPQLSSLAIGASPGSVRLHRELIGFRRERPWLTTAVLTVDEVTNDGLRYRCRGAGDREVIAVTLTVRPDGYEIETLVA